MKTDFNEIYFGTFKTKIKNENGFIYFGTFKTKLIDTLVFPVKF